MGRRLRILTRPGAVVEVVQRTLQGRYLIKPGPRMNPLIVGALAKAAEEHAVEVYSGSFLSGHFHLLLSARTTRDLAGFMRDFTRKLSIESGRLYNWPETTFPNRYRCTEVSDELEAQLGRLRYCLAHGAKENLVASPLDWPGVSFAEAMISGEPLRGVWIDRTGYHEARNRGEDVTLVDFTEDVELSLSPLPCLRALEDRERRGVALDLIRSIEEETAARHRAQGTAPLGAETVLSANPHYGPALFEPSPQPRFHAFSRFTWHQMKEALCFLVAAYREAANQLKRGDLTAAFPENTFPSALPFVEPTSLMKAPAPEELQPG